MRPRQRRSTSAWLRRIRRQTTARCAIFLVAFVLISAAQGVLGWDHTHAFLIRTEEEAQMAGYKRTVWSKGDSFVAEFHANNGSDVCDSWILVPAENIWGTPLRGFLYLVALLYTFIGIAIVSDIFMASIERITAAKTVVNVKDDGSKYVITVVVWNETVANLTLMALGSSAPEILMSVIETISTLESEPGEFGASTIVGSAAFNLFVITGVCMLTDKPKHIKELGVFMITSFTSVFAYVWMLVTLIIWTPDEVTIVEGVLTFLFFPLLVLVSYLQDRGWFCNGKNTQVEQMLISADIQHKQIDRDNIQELWRKMKNEGRGTDTSEFETLELIMKAKEFQKQQTKAGLSAAQWSHAAYRMNAIRSMTKKPCFIEKKDTLHQLQRKNTSGKEEDNPSGNDHVTKVRHDSPNATPVHTNSGRRFSQVGNRPVLEWSSATYSIIENEQRVRLVVQRTGGGEDTVTIKYFTKAGTAQPDLKYVETEGIVVFEPHETRKDIWVKIIDDKQFQEDQCFFVNLINPTNGALLGERCVAEVTIIDDDLPGQVEFLKPCISFSESCVVALIPLMRRNGADGKISVTVTSTDESAKNHSTYDFEEQIIEFNHEETMATAAVTITDETCYEKLETFRMHLSDPSGGAIIGRVSECRVTVTNDPEVSSLIDQVMEHLTDEQDDIMQKMGTTTWGEQFRDALMLDAHDESVTGVDLVMHFLTMFWKVLFSLIPPTAVMGGWATFVSALFFIGLIVLWVTQVAALFGCICGLPDPVTAITFVALGTSLPDLFASKTAIDEEEHADAAIGNVTGSNSVNVFLGLGLPWTLASIYKEAKGEKYIFPSGDLGYSVVVFVIGAVFTLLLLAVNRKVHGGELGGPWKKPMCLIMCSIWGVYIVLSSLKSTGHI